MRILKIMSILAAMACIMVSCDKIEKDGDKGYTEFMGYPLTWESCDDEIDMTQRAYLEKYTGVRCVNCPAADGIIHEAVKTYGEKLVVAAVHCSESYGKPYKGDPDLRIAEGETWALNYVGSTYALPSAMVNRTGSTFNPSTGVNDKIEAALGSKAKVGVCLYAMESVGTLVDAEITLHFAETITEPLVLTLIVVEDSIFAKQNDNGTVVENYQFDHVLRQVVTDTWGNDVTGNTTKGKGLHGTVSFPLREDCMPEHCSLIALVSYKGSKEILNSACCSLR